MPSSSSEFREPSFMDYELYHQTWHGDASLYTELLPPQQDVYFSAYAEGESDLASRRWKDGERTDRDSEQEQLPYSYSRDGWLGSEHEPSFIGGWENLLLDGYGFLDNGFSSYGTASEKTEDLHQAEEQCGIYYSYGVAEMQPEDEYSPWSGFRFGFDYGVEDDFDGYRVQEADSSYDSLNETRLCEMIFGHWPSLLRPDQETYVEQGSA